MTSGTPLLISGDQSGRPLCRVETKHGADQFTESFLQETIDRWPNILPIRDFYPNVKGLCSLGREIPVDLNSTRCSCGGTRYIRPGTIRSHLASASNHHLFSRTVIVHIIF